MPSRALGGAATAAGHPFSLEATHVATQLAWSAVEAGARCALAELRPRACAGSGLVQTNWLGATLEEVQAQRLDAPALLALLAAGSLTTQGRQPPLPRPGAIFGRPLRHTERQNTRTGSTPQDGETPKERQRRVAAAKRKAKEDLKKDTAEHKKDLKLRLAKPANHWKMRFYIFCEM